MSEMLVSAERRAIPSVMQQQQPSQPVLRYMPVVPSTPAPTFNLYIVGGCEISLCVAIDFTRSKGDSQDPESLYHIKSMEVRTVMRW